MVDVCKEMVDLYGADLLGVESEEELADTVLMVRS